MYTGKKLTLVSYFNLRTFDIRRLGVMVVATLVFIFYSGEVPAATRTWDGGGAEDSVKFISSNQK